MWKRCSARVEGVVAWVVEQVLNWRHVKISKANQTPGEIGGISIRPKDTAKSWVEQRFQRVPAKSRTNDTVNLLFRTPLEIVELHTHYITQHQYCFFFLPSVSRLFKGLVTKIPEILVKNQGHFKKKIYIFHFQDFPRPVSPSLLLFLDNQTS